MVDVGRKIIMIKIKALLYQTGQLFGRSSENGQGKRVYIKYLKIFIYIQPEHIEGKPKNQTSFYPFANKNKLL